MNQQENTSRFVFGLREVFYITSLIAAGLAFSTGSFFFSLFVLLFWGFCFAIVRSSNSGLTLAIVAVFFLLFFCCVGAMFPSIQAVREAARRVACLNNMRQLNLALLNYESTHSQYPEASKLVQGHRHSWRLAILPFIEQQNLYSKYDFSKSWDSAQNMPLAKIVIDGMTCPSKEHGPKTPYKLVTGPGTIFEAGKPHTLDRITDGTSNTIVLIEDHSAPVFWSDPDGDISIDEAVELLSNLDPRNAVHSHSETFKTTYWGTHVALADGSVHSIGFNADPELLRNAFLIADGGMLHIRSLGEPVVRVKYGVIVSAVIYGFLVLLPIFPLIREHRAREKDVQSIP